MKQYMIAGALLVFSPLAAANAQVAATPPVSTTTDAEVEATVDPNGATVTRETVTTGAGEATTTQTVETPSGNSVEVQQQTTEDGNTTTVTKTDKPTKKPK